MADAWLTYAQAAERFGISAEAVRQIAIRRKWPRRKPNDAPNGQVQVLVPDDAETRPRTPTGHQDEHPSDTRSNDAVATLREVIGALREQLTAANTRADQAEARAERADGRADKAEQGRETERTRADVERTRAETAETRAAELRTALDTAEARAAAIERAEAERRRRGLVARLRAAWQGD